jgi:predicted nucleic acid-binding protein
MALTVLDAGIIIGVLDAADPHHAKATAALQQVVEDGDALAIPASAYAEALVAPARRGPAAIRALDALLTDLPADVEPITRQVGKRASQLRASHGARLRLPDALVLATALHLKADRVLTTDRRWPDVGVRVERV